MVEPAILAEALQHLPPGIRWAFLAWSIPVVAAGTWLLTGLAGRAMLRPLARARQVQGALLHWTEAARLSWTARRWGAAPGLVAAGILLGGVPALTGPIGALEPATRGLLLAGVAFTAGLMAARRVREEAAPEAPRGTTAGTVELLALRLAPVAATVGLAVVLPPEPAPLALGALVAGAGIWVWSGGAWLSILRLTRRVRPAPAMLRDVVAAQAARAGRPPPPVEVLEHASVNAFALPTLGRLLFTRGAVSGLTEAELSAVTGHELGHLAEPASLARLRRLPLLLLVPLVGARAAWQGLDRLTLLAVLLGWLLGVVALKAALRRRLRDAESDADAAGAHQLADGPAYGRAIERIYRLNHIPAVLRRRGVHPDLFDRMVAVGAEPDWPRPPPPPRFGWLPVAAVGGALAAGMVAFSLTVRSLESMERVGVGPIVWTAGSVEALVGHGRTRGALGEPQASAALLRLACASSGLGADCAEAAIWLAELGRCEAAREALSWAEADLQRAIESEGSSRVWAAEDAAYVGQAAVWVGRCTSAGSAPRPAAVR